MKKFNCILIFSIIMYIIMLSLVSSIGINTKHSEDNLDDKINKYNKLLTQVNELEYQIKSTNFISINDIKEIDIELENREKKLKEIKKNLKERGKAQVAVPDLHYGSYPLLTKVRSFSIENLYPKDLRMAQKYIFFNKYEKLKALHIIKYNLEKKNQLKQIYQEYKSHDKIVEDLTDLYQQKITTII